ILKMTIDDTNVAASRGEVRIDTDGTLWTRATAAWKQYPQTQYWRLLGPMGQVSSISTQAAVRGMIYLTAFQVPQRMTIQKVYLNMNGVSGTVRFGLYADNTDTPAGGTKVADTGNVGTLGIT